MMGGVRMAQIMPEQTTKAIHPVLGIMGGLGPAASCYLYQMITDHTPAQKDQDHIDYRHLLARVHPGPHSLYCGQKQG